ncbi:hypothetical protein MATL_G00019420 [Megalops atlanticus]|uniref:Uncharacterized protein n=1 Tax=Megalops atlanticus TaxID=7932 RepID=A0A9D3QHR9_MEGAT|nr:hypothetical protein MATL_G00019420 [Megalops atlanticus]
MPSTLQEIRLPARSFLILESTVQQRGLNIPKLRSMAFRPMEKYLLLLFLLAGCYSEPQDLSGRVFFFPRKSKIDHVRLTPNITEDGLKLQ